MAESTIAQDLNCIACGYNLRTLRPDSLCPECGERVHRSVAARVQSKRTQQRRACVWLLIGTAIALIPSFTQFGVNGDTPYSAVQMTVYLLVGFLPHFWCAWGVFSLTRRDPTDSRALTLLGRTARLAAVVAILWPVFFYACRYLDVSPGAWMDRMAIWRMNGLDWNWFLVAAATLLFFAYFAKISRAHRALAVQFWVLAIALPAILVIAYFVVGSLFQLSYAHPYLLWPLIGVGIPHYVRAGYGWLTLGARGAIYLAALIVTLYAHVVIIACLWITRRPKAVD